MTAAVLGGLLALGLAGCQEEGAEPAALDRATGAVLADGADRLADALASDDPCRAIVEADALRERAAGALEAGDAPESVVDETTRVVDATTAGLTCEPVPLEDDDEGEDDEGEDDEGEDDAEAETDEGSESAPAEEPDTSSTEAPAGGGSSGGGDSGGGSSGGGSSGDSGPPDHARAGGNGGGGGGSADRPGRGGGRG